MSAAPLYESLSYTGTGNAFAVADPESFLGTAVEHADRKTRMLLGGKDVPGVAEKPLAGGGKLGLALEGSRRDLLTGSRPTTERVSIVWFPTAFLAVSITQMTDRCSN